MRIAFDIDGCINDFSKDLIHLLKEEYKVKDIDMNTYNILEHIGVYTLEDQKEFYKKHQEYFESRPPREDSVNVINELKIGNKSFIITARNYDESTWTERWLNTNNIKYDELIVNAENKVGACKWKHIDVMVEDNPNNAMCLAKEGIKVLLFDNSYNKEIHHENIIRCHSWKEIYLKINEMI